MMRGERVGRHWENYDTCIAQSAMPLHGKHARRHRDDAGNWLQDTPAQRVEEQGVPYACALNRCARMPAGPSRRVTLCPSSYLVFVAGTLPPNPLHEFFADTLSLAGEFAGVRRLATRQSSASR